MTWGKRRETTAGTRLGLIALAALLAMALVPAAPLAASTADAAEPQATAEESEGFVGTTDYNILFEAENITGKPALLEGSTLRVGSTLDPSHYDFQLTDADYPYDITSNARFTPKKPFSLAESWTIHAKAMDSPLVDAEIKKAVFFTYFGIYFLDGPLTTYSGLGIVAYGQEWNATMAAPQVNTFANRILNGSNQAPFDKKILPAYDNPSLIFSYDAPTDTITIYIEGTPTLQIPNIRRDYFGGALECYVSLSGGIGWNNRNVANFDPTKMYPATETRQVGLTFQSISLPNLQPEISDISLFRHNDATGAYDIPVGKYDKLNPSEVVQARCVVRNTAPAASRNGFDEQYSMHLKLANTAGHPTQGISPFAEAGFPMQVLDHTGKVLSSVEAASPDTLSGANGVPIKLVGYNKPVTVTYFARINQTSGQTVKVSHELIEDTFQGSQFRTRDLIGEQPLKPADKDDPTLTPGRDYHYTRLPAANDNGWNGIATSPVRVTFYGGEGCDFDRFTVSGADGTPIAALTPEANVWTRTDDTDRLAVEFKATGSATDAVSTKGTDTLRIDTQAPTLSWDADAGKLTASDAAPAGSGKAESGVWKVRRVKADGRSLAADDVTPQGVEGASFTAADVGAPAAQADTPTAWDFTLTDGKGNPRETISGVPSGFYVVEDAAGNVSDVLEVKTTEPPTDPTDPNKPTGPDNPGNPGDPTFPTITPKPSDPSATLPDPLEPTEVATDPATGLTHAVIEDAIALPTSTKAVTAAMMADLIDERYLVGTNMENSSISRGAVRLFNADGNPVDVIDRTHPGTWMAEQVFTDAAGNTTTLRLAITVQEDSAAGSLGSGEGNGGSDNIGNGHRTALANSITRLPQTGGILGPCPLHILFVLMMLMACAYSLMRLRTRRRNEEQWTAAQAEGNASGWDMRQGHGPCPTEGAAMGGESRGKADDAPLRYTVFDGIVHGTIALGAAALGLLAFCPWDIPFALATILVVAFWATLMLRRAHRTNNRRRHKPQPA